ncbi:response regulator FixJ [Aureimonas jatrophae]|uniref:Two component transcriptional regulator, LuxR family n=1 Tax=Aureimonas jatrophae TaxID=1166073 RepID=A0A1H0G7M3_9HYPH|nr:response regulator FixJ [Aureimonas jatrophae]MBB3949451.1 two-component system response regulator FixJ [Aureimonas jatrophae]SDO02841.1 two component transcriptional regulator, LuxR family [Aureimonas jatrophae]
MPIDPAVHVIDDDKAVRRSIAFLLSANGLPVRIYESGRNFLDLLEPDVAGCALCDVRMPGMDGIELLREVRRRDIALPFVVMTGHADVAMAVQAMKAGALDFIEKPFEDQALIALLREGMERGQAEGQRTRRRAALEERLGRLTPRERQVLELVAAGKQNKIIAHELGISPRTVEVHRANLIEKVEAKSTSDLIAIVLERSQT